MNISSCTRPIDIPGNNGYTAMGRLLHGLFERRVELVSQYNHKNDQFQTKLEILPNEQRYTINFPTFLIVDVYEFLTKENF